MNTIHPADSTTTMAQCPKGEYFKRTADAKRVWVRGEYNRSSKRYECHAADDVNQFIELAGNRVVFIGFTY